MSAFSHPVTQLYPQPVVERPLMGLYMSHDLRAAADPGRPFVYSNYVISLDGRIAVPHPDKPGMTVPRQIANERDWRLFQELAVQSDVIITSGRYLRDYEEGRAQELLNVYSDPNFEDLKEWRDARGLAHYPCLAVISGSLKFPIPRELSEGERLVYVFTTEKADPDKVAKMRERCEVIIAGETSVDARILVPALHERGLRVVYNSTGPKVQHMLMMGDKVDRLYLTHANRVLGGQPYSSIVEGSLLDPALDYRMAAAYHDPFALEGLGQLFLTYDRVRQ